MAKEIDREKIYRDLMSYYDGEMSADDFQKKTGFQVPNVGFTEELPFMKSFNMLMQQLDERGFKGLGGTSLINQLTKKTKKASGGIVSINQMTRPIGKM